MIPDLLTCAEVALVTRSHPEQVRRWARGEQAFPVKAVKVGNEWRWPADEIDRMLAGVA